MSVAAGITAPVHLCRRLFGEPVSCIRIQQTLETIIRKDLDRFQNKWNFQPPNIVLENKIRKPLSVHQLHSGNLQTSSTNEFILEPVQSPPSFYIKSPRKLKAFRRLPMSVAQKTRMELCEKSTNSDLTYSFNSSHSLSNTDTLLNDNQKSEINFPLTTESTVTITPNQLPPTSSSTPYKVNSISQVTEKLSEIPTTTLPVNPIIIRSNNSSNNIMLPSSSNSSSQHSIKLIKSDRLSLKKSGPKVTDYFAVKRRRQSMK
ncbi:unnamed protein product [Schistosoma rodhaini]|uniref:Uncharacterized protein n=1 Tax=Schistosoma rodhaini TaxID=6188 RepID=A0AA85EKS0_9TREM|nr:unnamed protein product [Schistosoma rodhaini]